MSPPARQIMAKKDSPQTLRGAFRAFVSFSGPPVILAGLLVAVGVRVWLGGVTAWDPLVAAAVVAWWAIQEWSFHRWLLHAEPVEIFGQTIDPFWSSEHRSHHAQPWNLREALLPWYVVLGAMPILPLLAWLIFPTAQLAATACVAYIAMGLAYEWTHFLTHTRVPARWSWYKKIHQLHRRHHFIDEDYWFSFTIPWIDGWLGTDPDPRELREQKG